MSVQIPAAGFGTWVFGGRHWGGQQASDSIATLHAAVDQGITHIDTAQGYGSGTVEALIGDELSTRSDYDDLFIATKTFTKTPEKLEKLIDTSRQRLQRDRIDLFYLHWPRRGLDLRPLLEVLENARDKGHIGLVGVSNFSVEDLESVQEVATIDAHQIGWNLIWRAEESTTLPYCREHDIRIVAYSALAQGVLTGKFGINPSFSGDDFRPDSIPFRADVWPHVHQMVASAMKHCEAADVSLPQAALAWLHQRSGSLLVGARNPEQLQQTLRQQDIPTSLLTELTELSDALQAHIPDAPNIFNYQP